MKLKNKVARFFHSLPDSVQKAFRAFFHPIYKRNEFEEVIDVAKQMGVETKGKMIFDIGANVGNYADAYLYLGAKIVCVEPNSACCAIIRKKFAGMGVQVEEAAISDVEGTAKFFNPANSDVSESSTCSEELMKDFNFIEFKEPVLVKTTTLGALMKKYGVPEFCKLDVEGFELKALLGMGEGRPRIISFEYHNNRIKDALDCIYVLSSLGYSEFQCVRHERFPAGEFENWGTSEMARSFLVKEGQGKVHIDGDIFCRFKGSP